MVEQRRISRIIVASRRAAAEKDSASEGEHPSISPRAESRHRQGHRTARDQCARQRAIPTPPTRKMLDFNTFDWATAAPHRGRNSDSGALRLGGAHGEAVSLEAQGADDERHVPASPTRARVGSLWMCAGALREIRQRIEDEGVAWFFCESQDPPPRLYAWAYAYYLSKYYELLDTFLPMIIKGRPPNHFGLHVFHHACVTDGLGLRRVPPDFMFWWFWWQTRLSTSWMYYYYFRAALKLETPWKAWVTRLQIPPVLRVVFVAGGTLSGRYGGTDVLGDGCDVWERRVQRGALLFRRRAPGTGALKGLQDYTRVVRASLLIS